MVGLGWDEVEQPRGLFGLKKRTQDIDCDASALLCTNGTLDNPRNDVVFYNNLRHSSGAVVHQGDNLTGAGDGDDEQIFVDLASVPAQYDRIVFVVTIYQARERKQHFGMIQNAFIRICDATTDTEFCKFNLSENYFGKTAMIVGEMVRSDGEWKFNAIGEPTTDDGIVEMAKRFS
jgi:stress response protein SCP2